MVHIIDVKRGARMFDSLPLPRCAVCDKMVDRLTRFQDNLRARVVFVAHCHGQTEETYANDEELYQWSRQEGGIRFGDAFVQNKVDTTKLLADPTVTARTD